MMIRKFIWSAGILALAFGFSVCPASTLTDALPAGWGESGTWVHFLGPNYNGMPSVDKFDPKGIEQLWTQSVHTGCSSVTVADGKLYTMGNDNGTEHVYCLDANTGDIIWTHDYESPLAPRIYEGGTNSTPTVADGRVYSLSRHGKILCLDAKTGDVIWETSAEKWKPQGAWWGFSDSPVVWGDRVFFNIGEHGLALNKDTGEAIWSSDTGIPAYNTIVPLPGGNSITGKPSLVVQNCQTLDVVDAETGESLMPEKAEWALRKSNCNGVTPNIYESSLIVMHGNHGLSRVSRKNGEWVEDWLCNEIIYDERGAWFTFNLQPIKDGYLFALAGRERGRNNRMMCIDLRNGKVVWQKPSSLGNLLLAGDKLITVSHDGEIAWGTVSGSQYDETFRQKVLPDGRWWAHPTLHAGRLYVRSNKGDLVCLEFE